jgi:heme oxygenase
MSKHSLALASMPPPRSTLERLRAETRAAHARIETVPSLARLMMPDLTLAEYIEALRRLQAFHAAVYPCLSAELGGVSGAQGLLDGAGLRNLRADLDCYGVATLPSPPVPAPHSVAAALGMLYVVEGSNLGGRVIGRHVATTLAVTPIRGGSFFCSLAATAARQRWQLLTGLLAREVDDLCGPQGPVIAGALATFEAMEAWMRLA